MLIDYRKLAILLLPTFLRQPILMSWLHTIALPLQGLHDYHQNARKKRMYELHHTSQICHIKEALNTEFAEYKLTYANGFEIEDIYTSGDWVWVYDEGVDRYDNEPHMLFADPTLVHDIGTIIPPTSAFIVWVPRSIILSETNEARIRAIVNKYRLASRTFEIKTRI